MSDEIRRRARLIARRLAKLYPDAHCELNYDTPLQLLVATILSAQCTDVRVNMITPALFARFPDAAAYASAPVEEIEEYVKTTGFYHNKAKNLRDCCRALVERHGGEVPGDLESLVQLPGVGRKSANVVLGNAFGVPGVTVDTHVGRLSRRMGLTAHENPEKVERDLMNLIPRKDWTIFCHRMIFLGRRVCESRKPNCGGCVVNDICPKIGVDGASS